MNRVILPDENYPIRPENIDISRPFWNTFDNSETENSANWLVRFVQERGTGWAPFTQEEIDGFYNRKFPGHFGFNRLVNPEMKEVGGGWIARGGDGRFWFTHEFVSRCFTSSPVRTQTGVV